MNNRPAIKVEHLSKKFARSMKRAMWYGLVDVARAALMPHRYRSDHFAARMSDANTQHPAPKDQEPRTTNQEPRTKNHSECLRASEFWALRDLSFEIPQGSSLGIIGPNGAGKSTLFSILSGIYGPSTGRVEVRGHLQALIALGAGFHPMLTGRENIYISAAVLGLTGRQIDKILDEIVDFAELEDFIDMPVKRYSSGMLVRLGFSVAVHMNPDVLLIDEVLSVGDLAFRNKSFQKMMSLLNSGITLLLVSHWPQAVEMVCARTMWLDKGQIRLIGETPDVVSAYTEKVDVDQGQAFNYSEAAVSEMFPIKINRIEMIGNDGQVKTEFRYGENITVNFHYECALPVRHPYFHFRLRRPGIQEHDFSLFCMHDDAIEWDFEPGRGVVECCIKKPRLAPGLYELRCAILKSPTILTGQGAYQEFFRGGRFSIKATREEIGRPGRMHSFMTNMPPVLIDHTWSRPE